MKRQLLKEGTTSVYDFDNHEEADSVRDESENSEENFLTPEEERIEPIVKILEL